ncbi:MAG TPA: hypothetical protein VEI97_05295 [bacterium]|nr:hypothetical protein [bacterium]
MTWPWTRARQERERREAELAALRQAEHQAYLDALKATVEIVVATSEASRATADTLKEWLAMFKMPTDASSPQGWVNNDLTEMVAEAKRLQDLKHQGFPVELAVPDQYAAVIQMMDDYATAYAPSSR